jgi:transposase-like protein
MEKCYAVVAHEALFCTHPPNARRLPGVYREEFMRRSFSHGSRLAIPEIVDQCCAFSESLGLNDVVGDVEHWIEAVIYQGSVNPLRHLVLVASLFADWGRFMKACSAQPVLATPRVPKESRRPIVPDEITLRRLFALPGATINSVSRQIGLSAATLSTRCQYYGIDVARRASPIRGDVKDSIADRLRQGGDLSQIARQFKVSRSTLGRSIASSRSLGDQRNAALRKAESARRRSALESLIAAGGFHTRSQLREKESGVYSWFMRHDRSWLDAHLPSKRGGP